jgi:N12 class adenine-specific DNA methylase
MSSFRFVFAPSNSRPFLLADDPGAGRTIMTGLLFKELKTRGLVKRTHIVTPANLTVQVVVESGRRPAPTSGCR